MSEAWKLRGDLVLSCNCTVFCPCVLSLGQHPPTEGYCQTWAGIRIEEGHFGDVDLAGLNVGLIIEIPGPLARGNWTAGVFLDEKASIYAVKGLTKIFTGRAGGSTGLLKILVGSFLGVRQAKIDYRIEGEKHIFQIPQIIDGVVVPVRGKNRDDKVVISNSEYWIAPDVTVSRAEVSRLRAFGRNWNFAGRSAEVCRLDWGN
ncbi:MAG TPA: DUF1326 domain-containing protein [Xanthobacteraceae bacterium]